MAGIQFMSDPGPGYPGFPIFGSKSGAASDWALDNTLSDIIAISSQDNIGREISDFIAVQAEKLRTFKLCKYSPSESKAIPDSDNLCGV